MAGVLPLQKLVFLQNNEFDEQDYAAVSFLDRLKHAKSDEERRYICAIDARESRISMLEERLHSVSDQNRELENRIVEVTNHGYGLEFELMRLTIRNIELKVQVFKLKQKTSN